MERFDVSPLAKQGVNLMCGIVGILSKDEKHLKLIEKMTEQLHSRGPNSKGIWNDQLTGVALGHRRLSILDLSPSGNQPMRSNDGKFVIVFNGEIYNHSDLRIELDQFGTNVWRGTSDTETLLACIERYGIDIALKKVKGMFAFALWDRKNNLLYLARDRLGEKPLYYGIQNNVFLFGSELKALKAHPLFNKTIDRKSLQFFFKYNYIPCPLSIYKDIYKLPPGSFLKLKFNMYAKPLKTLPEPEKYWVFDELVQRSVGEKFQGSAIEAATKLEEILSSSVRRQMVADVPLGGFLSGGIDSSLICALMQANSTLPVRTFSIGFQEDKYNEAVYAKEVAAHLGTNHYELYVSDKQAMEVIPDLPKIYDEPFSDSSQIPTYLVSQMAKEHVTVALSGDGGDELFGGYNRYSLASRFWKYIEKMPMPMRKALGYTLTSLTPDSWNHLAQTFKFLLPTRYKYLNIGDKVHKGAKILDCKNLAAVYDHLVSHWFPSDQLVLSDDLEKNFLHPNVKFSSISNVEDMMAFDTLTYLPDDILVKLDRAAMAVSLETRIPFLDDDVLEFAWRLPSEMKMNGGLGKKVLRDILEKKLPRSVTNRAKMGFGVPLDKWLRGPLFDWADSMLNTSKINAEGFLNSDVIKKKWKEHCSGNQNWHYHLWDVLMFQSWIEKE